jgi:hypothetical protein
LRLSPPLKAPFSPSFFLKKKKTFHSDSDHLKSQELVLRALKHRENRSIKPSGKSSWCFPRKLTAPLFSAILFVPSIDQSKQAKNLIEAFPANQQRHFLPQFFYFVPSIDQSKASNFSKLGT